MKISVKFLFPVCAFLNFIHCVAAGGSKLENFAREYGIEIKQADLGAATSPLFGQELIDRLEIVSNQMCLADKLQFFNQMLSTFKADCFSGPDPDEEKIQRKIVKATFSFSPDQLRELYQLGVDDKNDILRLFVSLNNLFTESFAPQALRSIILQFKLRDQLGQKRGITKPIRIQPTDNDYPSCLDEDEENELADSHLLAQEIRETWHQLANTKERKSDLSNKIAVHETFLHEFKILEPYLENIPGKQTTIRTQFIDPMIDKIHEAKEEAANELLADFLQLPTLEDEEKAKSEALKNIQNRMLMKYDGRIVKLQKLESQKRMLEDRVKLITEQEFQLATQKITMVAKIGELAKQIATCEQRLQRAKEGQKTMVRIHFQDAIAQKKFDVLKESNNPI